MALKRDGTVVAWGENYAGESTVPAGLSNVVAIAAGGEISLAITADLRVLSLGVSNQLPVLAFHGFAGREYTAEFSTNLTAATWNNLLDGSVPGSGQRITVTDPNPVGGAGARFYRIRQQTP